MCNLPSWCITTTRKHHGKQMFVHDNLHGYTSNQFKMVTFKTKKEAQKEINIYDHSYGKEIVVKQVE